MLALGALGADVRGEDHLLEGGRAERGLFRRPAARPVIRGRVVVAGGADRAERVEQLPGDVCRERDVDVVLGEGDVKEAQVAGDAVVRDDRRRRRARQLDALLYPLDEQRPHDAEVAARELAQLRLGDPVHLVGAGADLEIGVQPRAR